MIEPKLKICAGIGKAISVKGCGKKTKYRTFGLCSSCLSDFLFETDAGKLIMQKRIIPQAKVKVNKEQKKVDAVTRESLKTLSDYKADLQFEINQIIKYIDMNVNCISSNRPLAEKRNSGHIFSVGSNPTLRFNLNNIYNQSISDNKDKGGQPLEAIEGIKNMYGQEQLNLVLGLKAKYKYIGLTKEDVKAKTQIARSIVKHLKLENKTYNSIERIELRKKYNKMIGIYE
ncbi:MAG TPA: recombination protein NinG [Flavobacterium sp.]|nr:recombination protein NinG [Flavobacterium sp.]